MEANVGHMNHSLEVANVSSNVSPLTWRLTLELEIHPWPSNVGANVRGLTLTLTLALLGVIGANVSLHVRGLTLAQTLDGQGGIHVPTLASKLGG